MDLWEWLPHKKTGDSLNYIYPKEKREALAHRFMDDYRRGRIDSKSGWAKRNGLSWKTLKRYLEEFELWLPHKGTGENFHRIYPKEQREALAQKFIEDYRQGKIDNKNTWAEMHGVNLKTLKRYLKEFKLL